MRGVRTEPKLLTKMARGAAWDEDLGVDGGVYPWIRIAGVTLRDSTSS